MNIFFVLILGMIVITFGILLMKGIKPEPRKPAGIVVLTSSQADDVIENRVPLGLFICHDGRWIGIDNTDGNAWTEEFETKKYCEMWLIGDLKDEA
jgi:hypothetical protein